MRRLVRLVIGVRRIPGSYELVFQDPVLGVLPLDDTLTIEIWRFKGTVARQRWEPRRRHLYAELILSGGVDVAGADVTNSEGS